MQEGLKCFSLWVTSSITFGITPAAMLFAEIFIITTTDINGTSLIDINTFDRLCWILVNAKGTRHIVYSTNGNKPKVDLKPPWAIPLTVSFTVPSPPMQNTASNPRSQKASLAKRVASLHRW